MMGTTLHALIVEDCEDDAILVAREVRHGGYDLTYERVDTADAMREALGLRSWDVIIADYVMPHFSALAALSIARSHDPDIPFIIVSGTIGEAVAVDAMRAGANDYVMKGNLARLVPAIERELREAKRRRAGRAAQEAVTRLVTAVEQTTEAVIITDLDGTIQYVNAGFERITGYTREEAMGENMRLLKSGAHHPPFYQQLWATISGGQVWSGCFVNKKKDGTHYQEEATISPVRDESGKVVSFVGVKRDVTRERTLEAQLHQAQKMEAVGQLAGGVAHDFNNLLTTIFGYGALARDTLGDNHAAIKMLDRVQEAAEQAAGVTRALLTFSRKTSVEKKPIDLRAVIRKALRLLRHVLPDSVEVVTDVDDAAAAMVNADDSQLQQVIMNLAINARDAMPEGGTLRIGVRSGDEGSSGCAASPATPYVCLSVSDTGTGIPPDVRARIFEPFFTTKPRGEGTGLGLSIIHGIVKDHRGSIDVQSEVGAGTTFSVLLPAASPESVRVAEETMVAAPRGKGELILLAEDNRHVRGILTSTLEALNYRVIQAADGGELMAAFERHHADIRLLVIDFDLPVRDGLRCLRDMRGAGSFTPAIVITGEVGSHLQDELDEYTTLLRKPFQTNDLGMRVGRMLAAKHSVVGS